MGDPRHLMFCTISVVNHWLLLALSWSRYAWRLPVVRHLVALYGITFLLVLPLLCHDLRHSIYFQEWRTQDQGKKCLREANDKRLADAYKFLHHLNQTKAQPPWRSNQDGRPIDVAIAIITVSRNRHMVDKYEPHYLTQVVAEFLALSHEKSMHTYPLHIHISVCNVDHDPQSYKEALGIKWALPTYTRFKQRTLTTIHTKEKEKQDYVYCLNKTLEAHPRYVLLVEDDALPRRDLFPVLADTITEHLDQTMHRGQYATLNPNTTAYVKLYHPERLQTFISIEPERIPELLSFGAVGTTFLSILYFYLVAKRRHYSIKFAVLWVAFFVYSTLVALAIDRSNLMELRRIFAPYLYTFGPAPTCCTPAMLFPQSSAKRIVDYLNGTTCHKTFAKDQALDKYLAETDHRAYIVQPNTFSHIGLYSVIRKSMVNPFAV